MTLCKHCHNWAQFKVMFPESKETVFLCGSHLEEIKKQFPDVKLRIYFCGAIPLKSANVSA